MLFSVWHALSLPQPTLHRRVTAPNLLPTSAPAVPIAALPGTLPAVAGHTFQPVSVPGTVFARASAQRWLTDRWLTGKTAAGRVADDIRRLRGPQAAAAVFEAFRQQPQALRAADGYELAFTPGTKIPFYVALSNGRGARYRIGGRWYDSAGRGVRSESLRMPVDGAHVSSPFGYRRHPIAGDVRLHTGVDLSVPMGRKVYAAADGTIAFVGTQNGYGNYVIVRHNGTYETAYAHLRNFAPGLRAGHVIRRGAVIGNVGMTGDSTGPHLHFEALENGEFINPLRLRALNTVDTLPDRKQLDQAIAAVRALKQTGGTLALR